VQRSVAQFPRQGSREPWKVHQNYFRDLLSFRHRPIADGRLVFGRAPITTREPAPATAQGGLSESMRP
jgi:hypothetical protein